MAPETETPLFELRGVSYRVPNNGTTRSIFENLDLTIGHRDLLCIVGGSGCGKSTLLRTLIGLEQPSSGTVRFEGRDISRISEDDLYELRKEIGWVPQKDALWTTAHPDLEPATIYDVLSLVPFERGASPKYVKYKIEESFEKLGLPKDILYSRPEDLSGGERKRVAIARALILEPRVLLLDEPTTGLDPISVSRISDLVSRLSEEAQQRRDSLVIVTHDPVLIKKVKGKVGFLHGGTLSLFPSYRDMGSSGNAAANTYYGYLTDTIVPVLERNN